MTMIQFLINIFHGIPHFNFSFAWIKSAFNLDWKGEYAQALLLIAALVGAVAVLLLLTIIITWICQCCAREDATVKPRRKVRRLSTILFILSIFCFFFLGACLFGNDQINRGVSTSIVSLNDVNHQLKIAKTTGGVLGDLSRNSSAHVNTLVDIVFTKSQEAGVNKTIVTEIDTLLTNFTNALDSITENLDSLKKELDGASVLDETHALAERIEFERWLLFVIIPSIMLCVLFAGVISFCRQSKKGAIMFSGMGFLIFVIVWMLLAVVLPVTVGLADFCGNGGDYLKATLKEPILKSLAFYSECDPRPTHDNVPPHLPLIKISNQLSEMQAWKTKLDSLMDVAFNSSEEIHNISSLIMDDGTRSLKAIGALESSLACYAYRDDLRSMQNGICGQAVVGASVLTFCLVLLGLFLFTLLLIVSKSWNLFTRLGNDYIEVDEDDPFFPRNNDSNIPVDIYGTHVFNPRTRDRNEPSTGTTTATVNGQSETDALWNRGSAAPSNPIGRSPYDDQYGNYQDHYNL